MEINYDFSIGRQMLNFKTKKKKKPTIPTEQLNIDDTFNIHVVFFRKGFFC